MKVIDQSNWNRKAHFDYFKQFSCPYFNLCANVDITAFSHFLKENGLPFFVSFLFIAAKAANEIPQFRYRIRGENVVVHDAVHPSSTVLLGNDTFCYVITPYLDDFRAFVNDAVNRIEEAKSHPSIEDHAGADDLIYVTSIPWVSFTSISHPAHLGSADSIPRIAWGKYFKNGETLLMPLSVQGHHALMDGLHAGRYFERVQELLNHPELL